MRGGVKLRGRERERVERCDARRIKRTAAQHEFAQIRQKKRIAQDIGSEKTDTLKQKIKERWVRAIFLLLEAKGAKDNKKKNKDGWSKRKMTAVAFFPCFVLSTLSSLS